MANLSKIKREKMLKYLEKLKELNNDDENIRAITEIENALNEKKYGLVWEEHSEKVDEMLEHNIPIFVEDETRKITANENEAYNFLLEGDNLHSLKLLEKTHKGKIDAIYIDPPYNTGNKDFIYDDCFVDKTDGYAHSKWLSFMEKRLLSARELLNDDGFIFLSIDDNEVFQLKLLCDGIFGENSFIVSLPRQTKKSGKTTGSFSKNHDYVLVYSKGSLVNFKMKSHIDKEYKYKDEFFEERGLYKLNQTLDYDSLSYSKSLDYPLDIEGEIFYPGSSEELWKMRQLGKYNRADWAWRWSRSLFNFAYKNGFVVIKRKKDGSATIYTKTYANVKIEKTNTDGYRIVSQDRTKATSSIEFTENIYSNDNAKKDLKLVGLEKSFDYSKPISLVKEIIDFHRDKDIMVERYVKELESNVYKGYNTSMITDDFRSTSERLFEKYCEKNENVKYVYKNGDNGQQYLYIVYGTNFDKQRLFYPDYIVQLKDETIWLIETKGGEKQGQSKNIDVQIENKFEAFKQFANKHVYKFGFVRDKNDELYLNNTEYVDDMNDDRWILLEEKF